ncbi:MAG: hypothetical protein ACYC2U_03050 [Candidatus Amoebophilus sp.]
MRIISFKKIWLVILCSALFPFIISQILCVYAQSQPEKLIKNHEVLPTEKEFNPFLYTIVMPKHSHQTLKKVYGIGRRTLEHVVVKGTTKVSGYLKVIDSQLNDVEVQGRVWISNTIISGSTSIQGKTYITNTEFNNLTVRGRFSINSSKAKGLLDVAGKFEALNTTFEDKVNIVGLFKTRNSIFQKEVDIVGKVDALQTCFENTITIMSEKALLKDVISKSICVKKSGCNKKCCRKNIQCKQCNNSQIITLAGKTVIQGSITFESNNGIILLGEEATIEGQVLGGTIQKLVNFKK